MHGDMTAVGHGLGQTVQLGAAHNIEGRSGWPWHPSAPPGEADLARVSYSSKT